MNSNRRRSMLVDRGFQVPFLFRNAAFFIVFALMVAGSIYLSMWYSIARDFSSVRISQDLKTIRHLGRYGEPAMQDTIEMIPFLKEQAQFLSARQRDVLDTIMSRTNVKLLPVLGVLSALILFASLVVSHRIAGPVYRLKRRFNGIAQEGDLTPDYSLRANDEFKDLAAEIGTAVQRLSSTLKDIRHHVRSIKEAGSKDELDRHVQEIELLLAGFRLEK